MNDFYPIQGVAGLTHSEWEGVIKVNSGHKAPGSMHRKCSQMKYISYDPFWGESYTLRLTAPLPQKMTFKPFVEAGT